MFYICFNTNIVLCKSFYHKVVIIIQGKCAEIADRLDTLRINPTKNTANDYIEIGAVNLSPYRADFFNPHIHMLSMNKWDIQVRALTPLNILSFS
jgi:hypothetical protein